MWIFSSSLELAPFSPAPFIWHHFNHHWFSSPLQWWDLFLFLEVFISSKTKKLSFETLRWHMPHFFVGNSSSMVFEHLCDCFHLEVSTSGFLQLFELYFHITYNHIHHQIAHVLALGSIWFLGNGQPFNRTQPIAIKETILSYWLHIMITILRLFSMHFLPHQFTIATRSCEMVHTLNVPLTSTLIGSSYNSKWPIHCNKKWNCPTHCFCAFESLLCFTHCSMSLSLHWLLAPISIVL